MTFRALLLLLALAALAGLTGCAGLNGYDRTYSLSAQDPHGNQVSASISLHPRGFVQRTAPPAPPLSPPTQP